MSEPTLQIDSEDAPINEMDGDGLFMDSQEVCEEVHS